MTRRAERGVTYRFICPETSKAGINVAVICRVSPVERPNSCKALKTILPAPRKSTVNMKCFLILLQAWQNFGKEQQIRFIDKLTAS